MPKVSGLELLKQIKQINPSQKVVIITGYKTVETATEAIKAGALDYIVKPFQKEEILNKIKLFI
jgi:DNA-binding NtrC family response regulator